MYPCTDHIRRSIILGISPFEQFATALTLCYIQHSTMKRQQAAILGDSISPWTNKSVSVCWACALQKHRQISYKRSGTESQGEQLGVRRRDSRFTTTRSSEHGSLSILSRSLMTGTAATWSDGRNSVTQSCGKPASIKIPPFPAKLDMPYHRSEPGRQLGRGETNHEMSNTGPKARSEVQLPKPSQAEYQSDAGSPKHQLSQNRLRARNHHFKIIRDEKKSEYTLNTALDYWIAQKKTSSGKPLHDPPNPDVIDRARDIRSGHGLTGVLPHIARSIKVWTSSQRHEAGKLYSTRLMTLEARRSIQTVSPVGEHRTNPL